VQVDAVGVSIKELHTQALPAHVGFFIGVASMAVVSCCFDCCCFLCCAAFAPGQVDAVGVSIKELQTQAGSFQKDVGKVKGNIAAADTQLETIRSSRAALLESATLEQVGGGRGTGAQGHADIIVSLLFIVSLISLFFQMIS
jgi:hypothetical protein